MPVGDSQFSAIPINAIWGWRPFFVNQSVILGGQQSGCQVKLAVPFHYRFGGIVEVFNAEKALLKMALID
jgi:hypothetical protein